MMRGSGHTSRVRAWTTVLVPALLSLTLLAQQAPCQTSKLNQMQSRDFVNKGNTFMSRRQFQEALDEYQKAIDVDPSNAAARNNVVLTHLNWGAVHFAQNKFDEALQEWETVLKLDPYNQNAKHNINVLKQAVARRGGSVPAKPPQEKPKQEKKPESSVVILSPGFKQSQGSASYSTPGADDSSGVTSSSPATPEASSPPAADTTATPEAGPKPAGTPQVPDPPASGGSLEDQLSAIELKIYGHKQVDMTVFKRLEKMEMDTAGQVRAGTIKERIDFLKKSYGL